MAVDTSIIGTSTGKQTIVVDRGPIAKFADAILDDNPVYRDPKAAAAAGLSGIPAPATWGFAMAYWGAYPEIQQGGAGGSPGMAYLFKLRQEKGGTILHGEQAFEYHRPISVGDVLVGEGKITEVYERESGGAVMTFLVTENEYRDQGSGELVLTSRTNLIHRAKK
jgi:acyl dehydratase